MLISFKVANFKSINDEITITFNSTSLSEHEDSNVISTGRNNLLKSILLYGHNASGKSKILDGIVFCRWFVCNSALEMNSEEEIEVEPFQLTEKSAKRPSFFEIAFYLDNQRFRYGFEVDKKKVHREWLLESKANKEYPVFLRIGQKIDIDLKRFPNAEDLDKRTRKNALFISVAAQWNVSKASKISKWFDSICTVHGLADEHYRDITIDMLQDKKHTQLIKTFIRKADLGINDIEVVNIPLNLENFLKSVPDELKDSYKERFKERFKDEKTHTTIIAVHNKYNDNHEIIDTVPFAFDKTESEGTKKYFNLIGLFLKAIAENRLVIIDEFDARLHTLLSKAILKLFNSNRVKSSAQLLVASHDTALLDRSLLRRDQIYFIEKNQIGATEVTSLVEYKPRKEAPYDKNYLEGKYGAIPIVDDFESVISK